MKKEDSITNQVIKNSIWNFLAIFVAKAGGLLFVAIVARLLLPEKYGIYALATSLALLTLTLTNRGVNQTLSRYVAEAIGKNNKKLAAAEYKFILNLKFLLTIISTALLFMLAYPLTFYVFKKPDLFFPLIISSAYLFVLSFENFYLTLFYTIKKAKYLVSREAILQSCKVLFILFISVFVAKIYHISAVILILIISVLVSFFFLFTYLKKIIPFIFVKSNEKVKKKRILKFLYYSCLVGTSVVVFAYVDIIMLGIFLTSEYTGYYSAAFAIIGSLYSFILIANVLIPFFTQMKKDNLPRAFDKIFRYLSLISFPMVFGVIVLGKYFIRLFYGHHYLPAALPLYFLAILIFEMPVIDALKSLLFAREKPKYFAKIVLASILINISLNYFLITNLLKISMIWAMTGVAIATLVSRTFLLVSISHTARKKLQIFFKLKYIVRPLISALIMALALFFINLHIKDMTLLIGIGEIFLGAAIYITLLYNLGGFTTKDVDVFWEIISPKKRILNKNFLKR